jgi:folate-binding protein YgfZ
MSDSTASLSEQSAALAGYALLRETCGIFKVNEFALLEMRGADRKAWLQGQASNDIRKLDLGCSLSFCICSPTGQLLANCTAWSLPDRYLISVPRIALPAVLNRTETMIIMEDVEVTDLTSGFSWNSVQGPSASRMLSQEVDLPTLDARETEFAGNPILVLRSDRSGTGGWDVLLPANDKALEAKLHQGFEEVPPESLEIVRIEAGIPRFGVDMSDKTLPPEMGPDFEARHVSYNKGCYTGQEILMRIHSRGHTNRTWAALVLDEMVEVGMPVRHSTREDAGVVTSVAESPGYGFIAAASLRNEIVSPGEPISVQSKEGLIEGEVQLMPLLKMY